MSNTGEVPAPTGATAEAQALAENAPTAAEPQAGQEAPAQEAPAQEAPAQQAPEAVGEVSLVEPVTSPAPVDETSGAVGGQSFDYGQIPDENRTEAEITAEKVQRYDDYLRSENPNKVVYRAADGAVGGQSFDYGQVQAPAAADDEQK